MQHIVMPMNDPLKYIVVGDEHLPLAIVFNPILSHADVAGSRKVLSAGFCYLHNDLNPEASAWGKSETLGVESRGEIDAEIITQFKSA